MISYHGNHSKDYCCHASDSLEDILSAYIQTGSQYVAVTEHLPSLKGYLYPEEESMGAEELDNRFRKLMDGRPKLHNKYDRYFADFRVGFETEYYGQDPIGRIVQSIQRYTPEILIASLHHVKDMPIDFDTEHYVQALEKCGSELALVSAYYDQQYELIKSLSRYSSLFPIILGHMDLIKLYRTKGAATFAHSADLIERIKRNIEAAVAGGLVFEVNARGIKKGVGPYPGNDIIELIAYLGGQITFGDDSHSITDVGLFKREAKTIAHQYFSKAVVFKSALNQGYTKFEIPF